MTTVRGSLDRLAGARDAGGPQPDAVKVRCRNCRALNDEPDKFCGQCGAAL